MNLRKMNRKDKEKSNYTWSVYENIGYFTAVVGFSGLYLDYSLL